MGGLFATPVNKSEAGTTLSSVIFIFFSRFVDLFKAYFKQAREELALRLCDRLFDADGTKNKWWQVNNLQVLSFT